MKGQIFDKEDPESLGILYFLKCNSQNYIIYSTDMCRSCQGKTTAAYQGNIPVSSLFLAIWYPPSTGPETPDSWQPSALETLCFSTTFCSTLLVGFFFACVFVLWVSWFFFVAGVSFLHDRRTWARVTHVVADKHKREERIVCFVKTNDCRVY